MFGINTTRQSRTVSSRVFNGFIALVLGVAGIFGGVARAQLSGTGAISGTVQDPSGAIVAGATVTATNTDTNVSTTRNTTKAGDFNITPLIPGNYNVSVTSHGFEGYRQEHVTVNALETVGLNVTLTLGQATETVTVTSAPPLLSTTDATLGATMDNEMYSNLPIEMSFGGNADQRRATDFEYLMPGVQVNYTSNNSTDNSGIINGSGPAGGVSDIYIEGVDLPEADQVGDPRFTWTAIGVDAVNQFQVQTAGYSSQYAGQGVENFSIKSGGNAYHGSLYEYDKNTLFDAWAFTAKVPTLNGQGVLVPGGIKPREVQNEFGIVLSGPIIKNKLFVFGNYGQYRYQHGATFQSYTLPTAAMLGYSTTGQALGYADFTGYAAANNGGAAHIYDPATQTPNCSTCSRGEFDGIKNGVPTPDVIPASRISTAASYYNKYLLPYEQLANQNVYTNNLNYGTPIGLANWYSTGRIDYDQNAKNQISLIIAFGRQASTGPNSVSGMAPPFNVNQAYHPVTNIDIIKDTYTISPHIVNQLAFGFGRYQSVSVTPDDAPQYAASTAGLVNTPPGQATNGFPGITFSGNYDAPGGAPGGTVYGGYAWNSKVNNTYTTTDNLQWEFGKHNITIGGQYVATEFDYLKVLGPSGPLAYTFSSAQTASFTSGSSTSSTNGSPVASYLLGAASAGTTSANVPGLGTRWRDPSFWLQDDYKVSDKLTFNLGLRYDLFPSIKEAHNIFTFFNPKGVNSITGNLGTLEFAGNGNSAQYCNCTSPSPLSLKNVAPKLGVAYSVNPKTVVRASYSVNFARGDWTSGSQSGSPATLGITPAASAPAGISNAPAFYWDGTQCSTAAIPTGALVGPANDGVACGWTGSVVAPAPPAGGTSLAEYGTGETVALGNSTAQGMTYFDPYRGSRTPEYINWTFGIQREITRDMSLTISYVGSQGHFLSVSNAIGSRNNKLPESYASMAGYNVVGSTLSPCSGALCGYPNGGSTAATVLLGSKATATNLGLATTAGYAVPNPYNASMASYYASNSVYQYYLPFPQFSGVSDTTSFVGNTNFHALEISLRQRAAHGLDFMLNYTYSKSIDDVGTFRVYDNNRLDRSISTTDQPQNLTGTVVYASPFGKGKMGGENFLVRELASGWNLSSIFVYHTGQPVVFTGSGCGGSSILNTCEPNIVPGQNPRTVSYNRPPGGVVAASGYSNSYNTISHLNTAAFSVNGSCAASTGTVLSCPGYQTYGGTNNQVYYVGNGPALYVPGNATRVGALNTWGMGYYDLDLGLKRIFPIYEKVTLQLEVDMTNATNHVVFNSPTAVVGGSGYGEVTGLNSQNAPRDVQLSGRLSF
jgi:hypothetical protein